MSLDFLGLDTPNEHRLAWDNKDWDRVKELCKEIFTKEKDDSVFEVLTNVTTKVGGHKNVLEFDSYDQFMINSWLSQHPTMVGYASELNQWAGYITDQMHYDYLFHTIVKCKLPYIKYAKKTEDYDNLIIVKALARYYNVSDEKAVDFIELHDEKQLTSIKKSIKGIIVSPDCEFLSFLPNKKEKARLYKVASKW